MASTNFPACKHRKKRSTVPVTGCGVFRWLAAEPFRLFFCSGAVWSIIGVSLWPLFYAGKLTFYPGITHARLMIETFAAAFVVGFLGTAGPRMATAPKLTPAELLVLFALHTANGVLHLFLEIRAADFCFLALLGLLLACLVVRVIRFRKDTPPPQMLLALTGLVCGLAGTVMWLNPEFISTVERFRLAGLLVYQGLLLPPVLGIGSFIFPRILGGPFGDPGTSRARRASLLRALIAAALIAGSFFIEVAGYPVTGCLLRAGAAAAYLLIEIRWRRRKGDPPRGTLAKGLFWALITGLGGLAAAGFAYDRYIALEHLLFIGAFGLLIFVVGSRVLFGHSGELARFARPSWTARAIIGLAFLAATTRASAEFWPKITISHYKYAAWTWGLTALLWLVWHHRRFSQREAPDPAGDQPHAQDSHSSRQAVRSEAGDASDDAGDAPQSRDMTERSDSSPPPPGTPEIRPHIFDGIQEYDQRLPNWWLFTFYVTIVWFVLYWFFYYQLGWFRTDHETVTTGISRIQAVKAKELEAMLSKLDDNVLWEWSRNSQIVAEGKTTYDKYCFTCHAPDLTGVLNGVKLPGLPLMDKEWKYGNTPMSLFRMVSKGTPDKASPLQMPPWEQVLGPSDTAKVVAFVLSHHDLKDPGKVTGPGTYMDTTPPPAPSAPK